MNTRSTIVRCGTLVLATLFCTSLAIAGTPADAAGGRAGLIAYWSFDENDGDTAHDSSGYGNHGTIYNASWADGISGSALEFGGGDYVSVPISTSTTFTVTAWMRPYTDASSQIQMILDKPGNFNIEYRSSGAEGNRISQYTYQGDLLFSNTNLDVDAWSFIVLVRTPSVASFYLNGAYDGGGATSPRSVSGTCTIGSRSGASYQFEGIIDEMRIYDGALSAEEVLDLYEQYWSDCNSNGIPDDEEIAAGQGAGFEDASSWATYDAGAHGVGTDPDGYQGSVFDGRYAYFVPMHNGSERHGEVLRYDTDGDFSDVSSWAAFDAGANGVGTDPDGYASGAFDGRYVYFPPENNGSSIHGEALRYDTTGNFSTASSWSTYDAGANGVGSDSDGYSDAVFDGRYIYFVPYHNGSSYNGEVLRYDTEGSFSAALSWAVYAPGSHGVGNNPTGYQGGVFDGRYIYFVPCRNSSGYNGEVLRYDTTGNFFTPSSWSAYTPEVYIVGSDGYLGGYLGGLFDGRYIYFVPHRNSSGYNGEVLRYDTSGEFSDVSSWATFDAGANGVGTDPDGYWGAVFDGRHVYFTPHLDGTDRHGEVLRYDTSGEFSDVSSWATYDAGANGVGIDPDGYIGGVFDGQYLYFAPYYNGSDRHGEVLRYDTTAGWSADCNSNGIPDECDIAEGTSSDFDGNGVPDECEQPTGELLLVVAPGSECVTSAEQITVTLDVANLTHAINGVQALVHYDTNYLTPVSITPAGGWVLIVPGDPNNPDSNGDGDFTCALYFPGDEVSADGTVATLVFAPMAEGPTQVTFQDDSDPFFTKLTVADDNTTILPHKVDSSTISIDDTIATATSNSPVCEGGAINLSGGPDSGPDEPYTYAWVGTNGFSSTEQNPTISDATLDMNGTYTLTVTNGSGCEFVAQTVVEVHLCMVVNVEIEGLVGDGGIYGSPSSGTELDREVTFVFTDCDGDTDTYTIPVTFTADTVNNKGVGSATFTGLDAGFEWLGVQEGHTLRELVAVDFVTTLADSVTVFLPSGDFHTAVVSQDNMVDITDFSILASSWETAIGADQGIGGDAGGDGYHDADDFALIQPNFLTFGEGINDCGKLVSSVGRVLPAASVGRVPPAASEDGVISRTPRTSIDVSELRLRVPDARRADLDGNGVVDARDIRKFARRHNLSLQPAFDAKLAELEALVPMVDPGFEKPAYRGW